MFNNTLKSLLIILSILVYSQIKADDIADRDLGYKVEYKVNSRPIPITTVRPSAYTPIIDGKLNDPTWQKSNLFTGFIDNTSRMYAAEQTHVYLAYDDKKLYLAMSSSSKKLSKDDSYVLFLRTSPRKPASAFVITSDGKLFDMKGKTISSEKATAAVKIENGKWNCELAINYSGLGEKSPAKRTFWHVNFCRYAKSQNSMSSWIYQRLPDVKNFNIKELGLMFFDSSSPVIRIKSLGRIQNKKHQLECSISQKTKGGTFYCIANIINAQNRTILIWDPIDLRGKQPINYVLNNRKNTRLNQADFISYTFMYFTKERKQICYYRSDIYSAGKPSPLVIKLLSFMNKKKLKISLDTYGLTPSEIKAKANIKISLKNKNKEIHKKQISNLLNQNINIYFPLSGMTPGTDYTTSAELVSKNKILATNSKKIHFPDISRWMGNKFGISDKVPPPWTPVKVSDNTVSCWGRKYVFKPGSGFPAEITTRGESILAAPIKLSARTAKGKAVWSDKSTQVIKKQDIKAVFQSQEASQNIKIDYKTTVEYDGMIRIDFTLIPISPVKLNSLIVDIPLKEKFAKYLGYTQSVGCALSNYHYYGKLPSNNVPISFVPFVWLGDDDRGLLWFCESAKGWKPEDPKKSFSVIKKDGVVTLRLHVIEKSTALKNKLEFTMGLQASPVRPMPEDWRTYVRDRWHLRGKDKQAEKIDKNAKMIFSFGPLDSSTAFNYSGYLPKVLAAQAKTVKKLKTPGKMICPYTFINTIASCVPEFNYFYDEWKRSKSTAGKGKYYITAVAPNVKSWQDFIVWSFVKVLNDYNVDGLYYDLAWPTPLTNPDHGGYIDKKDKPARFWPIFGHREIAKRTYTAFREKKSQTAILGHCSLNVIALPVMSFCDIAYNGEQYAHVLKRGYMDILSLDTVRAELTCRQFGMIPLFLPEIGRSGNNNYTVKNEAPTEELLALLYLHDINVDRIWINAKAFDKFHNAKMKFIGDGMGIEFLPYWKNGKRIKCDNKNIKISAYKKNGELLFIISNFAKEADTAKITIDFKLLKINYEKIIATNELNNRSLKLENSKLNIKIEPRSLCIVKLGKEDPKKLALQTEISKELSVFDKLSSAKRNAAISKYVKNLFSAKKYKKTLCAANLILDDSKTNIAVKSTSSYYAYRACVHLRDSLQAKEWGEKLEKLNKSGTYWHSKGLIFQASELKRMGKFKKALAILPESTIKQMDSLQSEAYRTSGEIYKAMKKYLNAAEEYQKAADVTENTALKSVGYLGRGIALQATGKYSEAIKEYANVCKYNHPYYKGNAIVNALKLLKNKPQDSIVWIKMLNNDKKITPYWMARGLFYGGMRLKELGKVLAAKQSFQEAIAVEGAPAWLKNACNKELR